VSAVVLLAQPQPDARERTEALARRAADRLQALHDEADRLANQERSLLGDLRKLEIEREIQATELERARAAARQAAAERAALERQITLLTAAADAARPDIDARLVTLYKLGRGRYARLLLSASDLRQFAQAVRLVSALAEQDRQRLGEQQRRVAQLEAARAAARDRQARLTQLEADAERARAAAEQALEQRTALVRDIDTQRDLNAQFSSELIAAQQRLQASLSGLATSEPAVLPIAPFKGALDWPVDGTLRQRFGFAAPGRPPLRGIEIQAAQGSPVRVVHDGVVAFADTFEGYGRLVIVDHGNQTFTLYGNLDEVHATPGAHVTRDADIGTVGVGIANAPVLYFELRVDGRAVDPLQWLTKR
jgi:septal ring factor EnvC (AmiA/AmiB activator)